MRCVLIAVCWLSFAGVATADPARPKDVPFASPVLRYGNPHAPITVEVSDIARRGAVIFATSTLLPLVDKFPGVVSLQWTIVSRGTPEDDRAASAVMEAAAQANPWCYVRALSQGGSADEVQSDQFNQVTLLAAATSCQLDIEKTQRAIAQQPYRDVVPRHPPQSRTFQRITVDGVVVTRNINSEVGDLVERMARGQVVRPNLATRHPLIGRSRNAYERPTLNALPVLGGPPTKLTQAARGGLVMMSPAAPTWDIDVYCALDTICQALLGELARLAEQPTSFAMRVRWVPLETAHPVRIAAPLDQLFAGLASTDATIPVVCAALQGTSPPLLLRLAVAASIDNDLCVDEAQRAQAHQTTKAYTALVQGMGIRHDLTLVINGRTFVGGVAPSSLRELLVEDTSNGVMERLAPWLR